jgi:phosphoketolase
MRAVASFVAFAALVSATTLSGIGRAEEKVSLTQVPEAVLNAAKTKFPKAELLSAEKEVDDGKTIYEIAINDNGQKADVVVTADGKIVAVEKVIAITRVPSAVLETLKTKHPQASLKKAKQIFKDDKLSAYELLVADGPDSKSIELTFQPDGKLIEEEQKGAEPEDKK